MYLRRAGPRNYAESLASAGSRAGRTTALVDGEKCGGWQGDLFSLLLSGASRSPRRQIGCEQPPLEPENSLRQRICTGREDAVAMLMCRAAIPARPGVVGARDRAPVALADQLASAAAARGPGSAAGEASAVFAVLSSALARSSAGTAGPGAWLHAAWASSPSVSSLCTMAKTPLIQSRHGGGHAR